MVMREDMPKGFTETEKRHLQERLLDKGSRLFSTFGLKKTNVEEITRAVGISKGAFYLFYPSKEALFMDVIENMERSFRQEILAMVPKPGPTPRFRLAALLKHAFSLFENMPLLHMLSGNDYETLFRSVPGEVLETHLANDTDFVIELFHTCKENGINIKVAPDQFTGLLYPLVLAQLHANEFPQANLPEYIRKHLDLIAAYVLGEVTIEEI
jgi:AcrR family transcriptional regulator